MSNPTRPSSQQPKISNIVYPTSGQVVLVKNYNSANLSGVMRVKYKPTSGQVTDVFAAVVPVSQSFSFPATITPGTTPNGSFPLPSSGGAFQSDQTPVNGLPSTPPPADNGQPSSQPPNNMQVFIGAYNQGGTLLDALNVPFVAMPSTVSVSVQATHCIWLVYADPTKDVSGPFGETAKVVPPATTSPYVPIPVFFPDGATGVQVQVTDPLATWRHDPAATEASGPNGLAGAGNDLPLNPTYASGQNGYQSSDFNDDLAVPANIVSGTFPLNRLVGLWVYGDSSTSTTEFDAMAPIVLPAQPPALFALCLAFHDGYQWSNNSGAMPVQVTWLSS